MYAWDKDVGYMALKPQNCETRKKFKEYEKRLIND
jgi:hypothetical protein